MISTMEAVFTSRDAKQNDIVADLLLNPMHLTTKNAVVLCGMRDSLVKFE